MARGHIKANTRAIAKPAELRLSDSALLRGGCVVADPDMSHFRVMSGLTVVLPEQLRDADGSVVSSWISL